MGAAEGYQPDFHGGLIRVERELGILKGRGPHPIDGHEGGHLLLAFGLMLCY